jgi:putative ABC transport system substrate-binding protein
VQAEQEIGAAFENVKRNKAERLLVTSDSTINAWGRSIIENAAKNRLPALHGSGAIISYGGLMAYSADRLDLYRRAATYAVKIFRGAKPGDLPIEQPIIFELVINLKTAKALGIMIPDVVMIRADRVIK